MTTPTPRLIPGATVYSLKLNYGYVSGGIYPRGGELGRAAVLTVRKAAREYLCADCRGTIERDALHGSNAGTHYCAACVSAAEPESQFKRKVA